jgi:hypothetical protein
MNPALLTPRAAALLENSCYLISEDSWLKLAYVGDALESLIELVKGETAEVTLSASGFRGLLFVLSAVLACVNATAVYQRPCAEPEPSITDLGNEADPL